MAIRPSSLYPGQIDPGLSGWPYGKPRNKATEEDDSGTPLAAEWVADLWGFEQALLTEAGIEPNDDPDSVDGSQYLEAIRAIAAKDIAEPSTPITIGGAGLRVTGDFEALALLLGPVGAVVDESVEALRVTQSATVLGTLTASQAELGGGNAKPVRLLGPMQCYLAGRYVDRSLQIDENAQISPALYQWFWVGPHIDGPRGYTIRDNDCIPDERFGITNASLTFHVSITRPGGGSFDVPPSSWATFRRIDVVWQKVSGGGL